MTKDDFWSGVYAYMQDDDRIQFTFDNSVFWMLTDIPGFCKTIEQEIESWDDDDTYFNGRTITVCTEEGEQFAIDMIFDVFSQSILVSNRNLIREYKKKHPAVWEEIDRF